MHSWFLLLLFGSLVIHVLSRPQQAEYNNDSDVEETEEEDDNDSAADAYSADDEDTRLSDQEPSGQEEEVPRSRHLLDLTESRYLQRNSAEDHTAHAKPDALSDVKVNRNREVHDESLTDSANFNEQQLSQSIRTYPKRRQSNRYNDPNEEQQEMQQHLYNRDVSRSNRIQAPLDNQVNKRTLEDETTANEEGDMIFEKNRDQVSHINKNEYNANDASDSEQIRYFKQFHNTMQAESRDLMDDKTQEGPRYNLRDRRDIKEESQPEGSDMPNIPTSKENNDKTESEDEETAIKRHIKKLSSNELDQLLNSLTEEKRELLKKIIDDTEPNDNAYINKREITKKAGAVEENNYIENCQSDLSKVQGGSPSLELNTETALSTNTETTEINKQESQGDNSEATQKTSESSLTSAGNKLEIQSHGDDGIQKKSDNSLNAFSINLDPKNQADIVANIQVTSKSENKREANMEDLEEEESLEDNKVQGQDYSNDQGYFCAQDENLSAMDDESQPHEEKNYKREAYYEKQSELSDSVKNLEESFPNSNAYDDSGPYMGPLVRVKRKSYEQMVKKRSAGLLPDAKVAYFPYKAENEDEDNDEGNEFDDEGFYDRTSNFANEKKGIDENIPDKSENSIQTKNLNVDSSKLVNENESDTMSLGSDSDSVLSGVEGVDDNLMYNSGGRIRRTADDTSSDATQTKIDSSTSLMEDEVKSAHYQENDAFGPLPRNYDGDLARYKRIRRVKQLHNAQEPNSSDD